MKCSAYTDAFNTVWIAPTVKLSQRFKGERVSGKIEYLFQMPPDGSDTGAPQDDMDAGRSRPRQPDGERSHLVFSG